MTLDRVVVGAYETNCYIISKDEKVLVIDPGDEFDKIEPYLKGKDIVGVLVTHGHSDHVSAISNFPSNLIYDYNNLEMKKYIMGPFEFEVIYTPGHTSDSVTYYFPLERMMFTGDFLFKGTIGRTDFPTGDMEAMRNSLRKIREYPSVDIYPGHGSFTTLDKELENNIYFSMI